MHEVDRDKFQIISFKKKTENKGEFAILASDCFRKIGKNINFVFFMYFFNGFEQQDYFTQYLERMKEVTTHRSVKTSRFDVELNQTLVTNKGSG